MELDQLIAGVRSVAVGEAYRAAGGAQPDGVVDRLTLRSLPAATREPRHSAAVGSAARLVLSRRSRSAPAAGAVRSASGRTASTRRRSSPRSRATCTTCGGASAAQRAARRRGLRRARLPRSARALRSVGAQPACWACSSRDFARMAAAVYAANGVEVVHRARRRRLLPVDAGAVVRHPPPAGARRPQHLGVAQPSRRQRRQVLHAQRRAAGAARRRGAGARGRSGRPTCRRRTSTQRSRPGACTWWDAALHERYLDENLSKSLDPRARRALHRLHAAARHRPPHGR